MNTKHLHISELKVNENNPRQIQEERFNQLIASLIVFPKMLRLRPIIVEENNTALGGNMRFRGLSTIFDMSPDEIKDIIEKSRKMQKRTQYERDELLDFWLAWKKDPIVEVGDASDLSDEERNEFIAKDNIEYGEWDSDELANNWEEDDLLEWGLDIWQDEGKDYSDKNKEIDVNGLGDEVTLKLKYPENKYNQVKLKLAEIDESPEVALLKLLNL